MNNNMNSNMNIHNSTAEVEETIARIRSHKGVEGILIMTKEGAIIQSTLTNEQSTTHAALLSQLTTKTASIVQTLDNINNDNNNINMDSFDNDIINHDEKNSSDNIKNNDDTTSTRSNNNNIDELTFLRIRSKKREILIAPDNEFLMVVIQNPNISDVL